MDMAKKYKSKGFGGVAFCTAIYPKGSLRLAGKRVSIGFFYVFAP